MSKFREDQGITGQFAGLDAARHAKDNCLMNDSGCGPGENGC